MGGERLTALDVLRRCRDGAAEMAAMEDAILFRRATLERCTQRLSGMPQGGGMEGKMSEIICEVCDLEKALDARKRAHAAELCAGVWIMDLLPAEERDVLRGLYIEGSSLSAIARRKQISASSAKRYRQSGEERCAALYMDELAGYLPEWYGQARKK